MIAIVLVFAGGACGASARLLADRAVQSRHRLGLPLGTLVVNVVGCAILGVLTGLVLRQHWSPHLQQLIGTGFCGGLTTFSAFSVETVQLAGQRRSAAALGYVVVSLVLGLGVAAVGYALAR